MDKENSEGPPKVNSEKKRRGDRLGAQLRQLYDDVTHENVPEDFLRLLEDADKKRSASSQNESS